MPAMYAAIASRPLLAVVDGAWRRSGIANAVSRLRGAVVAIRSKLSPRSRSKQMLSRLRGTLRIRTRAREMANAVSRLRGTAGAIRSRLALRTRSKQMLNRVRGHLRIRTRARKLAGAALNAARSIGLRSPRRP
jgi:hypothetical protein